MGRDYYTSRRSPLIHSQLILMKDGDMDIVIGSRGEARILWMENLGNLNFKKSMKLIYLKIFLQHLG